MPKVKEDLIIMINFSSNQGFKKGELCKLAREEDSCAIRSVLERDSQPVFGSRHRLVVRKACIRCPRRSERTHRR